MLADFRFRARHITTSQWGSQRPRQVGSAAVPPAILNLRRPAKDRRQDAGGTIPVRFGRGHFERNSSGIESAPFILSWYPRKNI
jgi:hypothetical protein